MQKPQSNELAGDKVKFRLMDKPRNLNEYIGCDNTKKIIKIAISAVQGSGMLFGNTLLIGQRGMGKTTLAELICMELGTPYRIINGRAVRTVMDLNSLLMGLTTNGFLIIDEVHGLRGEFTDLLHQAMDTFVYTYSDINHRIITIKTPPFSLIAATTSEGKLSLPFLSRFRRRLYLEPYTPLNLQAIVINCAKNNRILIDSESAYQIAIRSNGIPRHALNNLMNIYEYSIRSNGGKIDLKVANEALDLHGIDAYGLNQQQRNIIKALDTVPLGLQNLESRTGISQDSILNFYEPFLLQIGFIERTPRGRVLTASGKAYKSAL